MAQLSPGIQVNEIDLSIVVPTVGNAMACFAGDFTKGPADKFLLITNVEQFIDNYGYPTNKNANEWYQIFNFLQYSNKILVSRTVANNSFRDSASEVYALNEDGKVEITGNILDIQSGDIIKFKDLDKEYFISTIENPVDGVKQVDAITIAKAFDVDGNEINVQNADYTINLNGADVTFNAQDIKAADVAIGLGAVLEQVNTDVTNVSISDNVITHTAGIAGTAMTFSTTNGSISIVNTTANVVSEKYELVLLDNDTKQPAVLTDVQVGFNIKIKDSILNALVTIPKDGSVKKLAQDLKKEVKYFANEDEYLLNEPIITGDSKLKFTAKSGGSLMNGIQISIAKEEDFASGKTQAFYGVPLNDLFETKPLNSKKEIAVIIRQSGKIKSAYIASLNKGAKDYRGKSSYIEDVINKYDDLLYVQNNTVIDEMPDSRLYSQVLVDNAGLETTNVLNNTVFTSNGNDGSYVSRADIARGYGSVAENTLFGAKEDIEIDIVITNEKAREIGGNLANDRADCIAFSGAKFEDTVGLKSVKVVENLVKDIKYGSELGQMANSYNAFFSNYKLQYDKYNDKNIWVNVAGDVAGLRAAVNTSHASWWASAGLINGKIKNCIKLSSQFNVGQRDLLYKNNINPVLAFPGQGNAIVFGQKTMSTVPSAFDRINVRGLFNTIERSITKMGKYFLFEFNDSFTRNRFKSTIVPFLESVKSGRGIYDFYVRCDESNNTPEVIDKNGFVADIAVQPARTAEFMTLNFFATPTGIDFKEIFA